MFDKCITCERLGQDCVPNLMALPFTDIMEWWKKRQAVLGWTNQVLHDKSGIPLGTITRIKSGEDDCKYSTMRCIIHALMGGHAVEFPCQKKLDAEFAHCEELEKQNIELVAQNKLMAEKLATIDDLHRNDIRIIKSEYQEEIAFLKDQLRAWQRINAQGSKT